MGELILCVGLVLRVEHTSRANKEPVHYYHIGVPRLVSGRIQEKNKIGTRITH